MVLGWYLNQYIVAKLEYVDQTYNNFYGNGPEFTNTKATPTASLNAYGSNAGFQGIMVEAAISF